MKRWVDWRKSRSLLSAAILIWVSSCALTPASTAQPPYKEMVMATTTSTQDSGLLDAVLPVFTKETQVKVKVVAVGTGQALKLGSDGNADVVLVHARKQEDDFVKAGDGIDRRDVMHNDFIVLGPVNDPAKVAGLATGVEAFRKIAAAQALFASRGDNSGTQIKEQDIWNAAGGLTRGSWYLSTGQGMGETLSLASEKGAYTLSDRATYVAQRSKLALQVMVGGNSIGENRDPTLLNPYGVIPVNPAKHPGVQHDLAEQFARWITGSEGQKLIGEYGVARFGQPLFVPDALK